MDLRVYFKKMDSSLPLYAYASNKIGERLAKFAQKPIDAHITFEVENGVHLASLHVATDEHITLDISATDASSMYSAVDRLVDRFDESLRRRKERLKSRRKPACRPVGIAENAEIAEDSIDASAVLLYERQRSMAGR